MKTRWPGDLFDNIQQMVTWQNDFVTRYTNIEHISGSLYTYEHVYIQEIIL